MSQASVFHKISLVVFSAGCLLPMLLTNEAWCQTTDYTSPQMTAGNVQNPFVYVENDFGISFSSISSSPDQPKNKIQVKLKANDPNFQYIGGPRPDGIYYYLAPGRYQCDTDPTIICLSPEDHVTYNVLGLSVPTPTPTSWQGTVEIVSLNQLPFYVFPPDQFTVNGHGGTPCLAHYDAWQTEGGPWHPPFFWDAGYTGPDNLQGWLISPYGNYYNTIMPWDRGWSSNISFTNNSGVGQNYRIVFNQMYDGYSSPQPFMCAANAALTPTRKVYDTYLPDGSVFSMNITDIFPDLRNDHNNSRGTEGTILIHPYSTQSVLAVNNPSHEVRGNPTGSFPCGTPCP